LSDTKIGTVMHYFPKISVGVLNLDHPLKLDHPIHIVGKHTDFSQRVTSMQVNHQDVEEGYPGQEVAIKVTSRVRPGDDVYLASE